MGGGRAVDHGHLAPNSEHLQPIPWRILVRQRRATLTDDLPMEDWQRTRALQLSRTAPSNAQRLRVADDLPIDEWQTLRNLQAQGSDLIGGGDGDEVIAGSNGDDRLSDGSSSQLPSTAWGGSPAMREAQDARSATPLDPEGLRHLPVTGPIIDAYEAAKRGDILAALGDGVSAVADVALIDTGVGVAGAVSRRTAWNTGKMTGNAVRAQMKRRGVTPAGHDLHHTFELNGIPRKAENWRNHPAFMKVLPHPDHMRLHGPYLGLPEYDDLQKLWVGTPRWMKTVAIGLGPRLVQGVESLSKALPASPFQGPTHPAPYGERPLR